MNSYNCESTQADVDKCLMTDVTNLDENTTRNTDEIVQDIHRSTQITYITGGKDRNNKQKNYISTNTQFY